MAEAAPRDSNTIRQARRAHVESQGPLAILWVGIGLCCFYIALVWLNMLLGFFLTPLFMVPGTWLMDILKKRREEMERKRA